MFYIRRRTNKAGYAKAAILGLIGGALFWEFFGEKIKRKVRENETLQDFKDQVYDRAGKVKELTRDQYDRIVDEVGDKYGRLKGISQNELQDMISDLKGHWARMKDAWNRPRGPGGQDGTSLTNQLERGDIK
ncbi:MAG: hypothetical protein ACM3NH_04090 [Candidatus Saccharibacteria bacterium]